MKKPDNKKTEQKPSIAVNRKARHDYFLLEKFEAGICLLGYEVKSIREGKVNLKDSFVRLIKGEPFLFNCHISPYSKIQGHIIDLVATRTRKLLLHKAEVGKLEELTTQKGLTVVPTEMYFKHGLIKVQIAVAKGKKQFDKREDIKRRMHDRESAAAIKSNTRK